MGNGSILPVQQPFPMICTPSAIYLSRNGRLGITYNVHRHMNCDAWNLRADDSSDSLSCCLPMRMNAHLDTARCFQLQTHTHWNLTFPVCSDWFVKKSMLRVFKGLQTHLFTITSIPACTGAWRGHECGNNWAKCGENEQDECIGAKGGGSVSWQWCS